MTTYRPYRLSTASLARTDLRRGTLHWAGDRAPTIRGLREALGVQEVLEPLRVLSDLEGLNFHLALNNLNSQVLHTWVPMEALRSLPLSLRRLVP